MTGRAIAIATITVIATGGDTIATDGIVATDIGIAATVITDPDHEGRVLPLLSGRRISRDLAELLLCLGRQERQ